MGALDAEYEAFNAGFAPGPSSGLELPQRPQQLNGLSGISQTAPAWAADFHRLHLSSMSTPIPQQDFRSHAPLQRSTASGWHQDFARQNAQELDQAHQQSHAFRPSTLGETALNNGYGMGGLMYGGTNMSMPEQGVVPVAQSLTAEPTFDESALERAFEEAALADVEDEARSNILHGETTRSQEAERAMADDRHQASLPEQNVQHDMETFERIGADTIEDTLATETDRSRTIDGDELARTAGALLDRVKDDHSAKFQQSSFLALMRQLRDKEIVVDGEQMVPVSLSGHSAATN